MVVWRLFGRFGDSAEDRVDACKRPLMRSSLMMFCLPKPSDHTRLRCAAFAVVALLGLSVMPSCQRASDARTKIVDSCTKQGERCRHSSGQVGYCTIDKSGALQCMSQH